ncbi:MAG: DUF6475 domain-containing protein [Gammaproteobacteria bacterium]
MDECDVEVFACALTEAWDLCGGSAKVLPAHTLEEYWQRLKGYPLVSIQHALDAHILCPDRGRFVPKIADIMHQFQGNSEAQALKAWSKVSNAIRRTGSYESVVFDDLCIHCVIADMGGWIRLCCQNDTQLQFSQHEFQKRYRYTCDQVQEKYPSVLIGVIERNNHHKGYKLPPPIFIGDRKQALQVMLAGSKCRKSDSSIVVKKREQNESIGSM